MPWLPAMHTPCMACSCCTLPSSSSGRARCPPRAARSIAPATRQGTATGRRAGTPCTHLRPPPFALCICGTRCTACSSAAPAASTRHLAQKGLMICSWNQATSTTNTLGTMKGDPPIHDCLICPRRRVCSLNKPGEKESQMAALHVLLATMPANGG